MYNASSAFHQAVANGAHQIALLIFSDAVFTNDDINVSSGIEFNDYFNTEEDLSIGQALSNELSFNIFNDTGVLNEYEFGDFLATIGAQIGNATVQTSGNVYAESAEHVYIANNSSPYLTRDGSAVASQPVAKIISILIYEGNVYCRLTDGTAVVYKDSDGSVNSSASVDAVMLDQMGVWAGKGIAYADRILKIWKGTNLRTYEFVPLGYFTAERPNVPYVNEIHFTCNDFMVKFDIDMPSRTDLGINYPITIGNLFKAMCEYVGVQYYSNVFINSTATITSEPDEFENTTMRQVLQWIAEAAASVLRFNRDGQLVFDWLRSTSLALDEGNYSEFAPYWYETKVIDKLYNRRTENGADNTVGTGENAYLIQDNPLLRGVS